jgi:hypothetical protein
VTAKAATPSIHAREGAKGPSPPSSALRAQPGEPTTAAGAGELLCAACGHVVTHEAARISVDGAHVHVRTNPHGYEYEIGCFSEAPGVVPSGAPSMQATWFPDHFWWIRLCGGCQTHLGWEFFRRDGQGPAFYALILARLRRAVYDPRR